MSLPLSSSDRTESLMDWFQLHSRQVIWGSVALIAVVIGGWFYTRSQQLKAQRAETAYFAAERSVVSGNLPLAESDLQRMVTRYDGAPAAMEGRLALAQVLYDQKKYQAGINELKEGAGKMEKSSDYGSGMHVLMAAGYEQLKKFKEAGGEYQAAAKIARFDADRQRYESFAAKDYLSAGDSAKARSIWTVLGADSKGTVAGEARVRLGEMDAKAEPKA